MEKVCSEYLFLYLVVADFSRKCVITKLPVEALPVEKLPSAICVKMPHRF